MIKKLLLNLSKQKTYLNFIDVIGYIPFIVSKGKLETISMRNFNNTINYLIKKEKLYKRLEKDNLIEIMLSLAKSKIALLDNKFDLSNNFLNDAQNYLNKINNINFEGKSTFIFSKKMLSLEIDNIMWVNKVEDLITPINNKIESNKKEIYNIKKLYEKCVLNSEEHLLLTKNHLELVCDNVSEENNLILDSNSDLYLEGNFLLNNLNRLKEELIKNNFVSVDSNKKLLIGKSNLYNYMLYCKILAELIKIKFYLNYSAEELFNDVHEIVKLQIIFKNNDPVSFLYQNNLPDEIFKLSPFVNQKSFINYIHSFIIEMNIFQENNNFSLRQMKDFIAKDKSERLIIKTTS